MSIASLNQTGLPSSSLSHRFSPPNSISSTRSAAFGEQSSRTDQLAKNASLVNSLPTIRPLNTTDYARLSESSEKPRKKRDPPVLPQTSPTPLKPINLTTTPTITQLTDSTSFSPDESNDTTITLQLLENAFIFTLLVAALALWNVWGFFIQIKLLFFTETRISTNQLFDNCTASSSYFKYMVRLRYSSLIGGYQANAATIMIDLLDIKDQFVTRFTISPALFAENLRSKSKAADNSKVIKLRLNRRNEFPEIGCLRCVSCADFFNGFTTSHLLLVIG